MAKEESAESPEMEFILRMLVLSGLVSVTGAAPSKHLASLVSSTATTN